MDQNEHYTYIIGTLLIALSIILMVVMFRAIVRYDSFRVIVLFLVIGSSLLGYQQFSLTPRSDRHPGRVSLSNVLHCLAIAIAIAMRSIAPPQNRLHKERT